MKYFTIEELCNSVIAEQKGINNTPNLHQYRNLVKMVDNLLDPSREMWGDIIIINSGFRCEELNKAVGGVENSDHKEGCAVDMRARDIRDNGELFTKIVESGLPFRQIIWEQGNRDYPKWIHISYVENDNKRQIIRP